MSTPPPVPPDRPDDELDPTGIRDLLAGLPDPGPMPPDLVDRIQASIAREQSARRPGPVVVPLRRRSVWPKLAVAAAAVAVVGVGVPALLGGGDNPLTAAFSGSARDDAASSAQSGAEGGSAGPQAPGSPSLSDPAATAQPDGRAVRRDGVVSLVVSGTAYTSSALAVQAQRVVGAASRAPQAEGDAASGGPASTPDGLRDCLHALGVEDWQPVTADVATFEGREAVVAVVDSDTGQAVWVVPPDCSGTHAHALAGPLPLG